MTEGPHDEPTRVSIITVVRNSLVDLKRTRLSVEVQDFLGVVEHVIVDGASTDGTPEWLATLTDPSVRWVSESDEGIYHAMNKGAEMATGQYLIFLNAGDTFRTPDVLTRWTLTQRLSAAKWTYSRAVFVDELGVPIRPAYGLKSYRTWRHAYSRLSICHQAVMMQREFFIELGGFDMSLGHVADYALLLKAGRVAEPVVIDSPDINYLDGGASAVNQRMSEEKHVARLKVLELTPRQARLDRGWTQFHKWYIAVRRKAKRLVIRAGGESLLRKHARVSVEDSPSKTSPRGFSSVQ